MMVKKRLGLLKGVKLPNHVAIIPDGNRRWAKERGLPTFEGHRQGFKRTVELVRAARDWGIHTLTLWGFSTENWKRSRKEVAYLMRLYREMIDRHLAEAHEYQSQVVHLGRKDRLPKRLLEGIEKAERETRKYSKYVLNIGLDYGGRDEVIRAIQRIGKKVTNLKEEDLFKYLDTAGQKYPEPDLIVRPGEEWRDSGLLMYQGTYTEFYFDKVYFPDFTPERLKKAILEYSRRQRRFGGD
jgi:undecaprenyl diphosphate synthase